MDQLKVQMKSVTQSVLATVQSVSTSRRIGSQNLRSMMSRITKMRLTTSRQQKLSLAAGCHALVKQVKTTRMAHRADMRKMGNSLRARLAQTVHEISTSVASLCARYNKSRDDDCSAQLKQNVHNKKVRIAWNRLRIKSSSTAMNQVSLNRKTTAQASAQGLHDFAQESRTASQQLLQRFRQSHTAMASQMERASKAHLAALRGDVAGLRRGFNADQSALRRDLNAGAQIWRNRNQELAALPVAVLKAVAKTAPVKTVTPERLLPSSPVAERQAVLPLETVKAAALAVPTTAVTIEQLAPSSSVVERQALLPLAKKKEKVAVGQLWATMSNDEKILFVMQENPKGVSAAHIGERVSLHAMMIGKHMKKLIDKGFAHKDEESKLYTLSKGSRRK
jgi:DNA-binding IclR family transcriptional regulator